MTEPLRLAKRVAALAGCSRREAELYIEGGWVRVDGVVVEEPQHRVTEDQLIELDPAATAVAVEPVTLLLHKPAGAGDQEALRLLTPAAHAGSAPDVRIVRRHFAHLAPLLPLPALASGLAVFSQQRGVIRRLTEDASTLEQEVLAEVAGDAPADAVPRLCHGLAWQGRALPPIKVSWQSERRLRFALKGIPPELVPWMGEQVGLRVVSFKRIRIGRVPMAGLAEGQWRFLRRDERF
ncbi:RNA-binding protein [Ramlibacter sp. RBP-2]|uniref:Dual-specificity RNA pseudouridine synthase RluF n=1 Tax=Ramlibacter lithotrophicus TaxID=2606681 RepID=A0A7X6I6C1_9BURK|nr:RNA pseudouridine synthase [Ramlibacter lithotrophicus]NKE66266.1 RNA-binding protein [Ramlibacter lithotrophicus]